MYGEPRLYVWVPGGRREPRCPSLCRQGRLAGAATGCMIYAPAPLYPSLVPWQASPTPSALTSALGRVSNE